MTMYRKFFYRQSIWVLVLRLLVLELVLITITQVFRLGYEPLEMIPYPFIWWSYWVLRVVEFVFTVVIVLKWSSVGYYVSEEKVIVLKGLLKDLEEVFLMNNIEVVKLKRGVFGVLFNYGTISLYAPTLKETIYLKNIPHAKEVCAQITGFVMSSENNKTVIAR